MTPVEHADLLRAAFCCHVFPTLLDDALQNDPERDAEGLFIPVVDWLNERLNDPNSILAPVSRDAVRVDDEDIRKLRLAPGDSFHLPTFFTSDAWSRLPPAQVFMAISEWVRSPQHATAVETERGVAMDEGDPTPTTRLILRRMQFSGRFIEVMKAIDQHSASFRRRYGNCRVAEPCRHTR